VKTTYTASDLLHGNVDFEDGSFWFDYEPLDRKRIRNLALHLLAVAEVDEKALQALVDQIDKPTEDEAMDEAFDVANRVIGELRDRLAVKLGFTEADLA
jgi:hypothetical protein